MTMGERPQHPTRPVVKELFAEVVHEVMIATIREQIVSVAATMRYNIVMRDIVRKTFNLGSVMEPSNTTISCVCKVTMI